MKQPSRLIRRVLPVALVAAALVVGPTGPVSATFPGANDQIAFISARTGKPELHLMDSNGENQRRVALDLAGRIGSPAWSADGRQLAFTRIVDDPFVSEVHIVNRDGSGLRRLSPAGAVELEPAWSPDGSRIAFTEFTGNDSRVVTMRATDGGDRRFATSGPSDGQPDWSPDGTRIAFARRTTTADDGFARSDIFILDALDSSASPVNVTNSVPGFSALNGEPSWSPDGTRIAYSKLDGRNSFILIQDANGSNRRQLTAASGFEFHPSWSPDGTMVAFDRNQEVVFKRSNASTFDGFGTLTSAAGRDDDPAWGPVPEGPPLCQGRIATIFGIGGTVEGTAGADVIFGSENADVINGGGGNDVICGNGGNDTLNGGSGADDLVGGPGTDTATYADRGAVVVTINNVADDGNSGDESAGDRDNVRTTVERLIGGGGNDKLTGSTGSNRLDGGAGNDVLDGGSGIDTMIGGTGTDTASYATRGAAVTATIDGTANDGSTSDSAKDNISTTVENLVGGSGNDSLTGSSSANRIDGGNGSDKLFGLSGADTLIAKDGVKDARIDCGTSSDPTPTRDSIDPAPISCP